MERHRSISDKMKRVKTYDGQFETLDEWIDDWEYDFKCTVRLIESAIRDRDYLQAAHYLYQLNAMQDKKFFALRNINQRISDPDRSLKTRENNE